MGINIPSPKWEDFDLRSFEDNMKTVHHQMPPFKHEFYAIAIKADGDGFASTGNYSTKNLNSTVFFNSPYQITSWDIAPNWNGFYVIFSEDFYRRTHPAKRITEAFPFLLNDNTIPMELNREEAELYTKLFSDIQYEFQRNTSSSKTIIAHYLHIVLHKISRLYAKNLSKIPVSQNQRNHDLDIISRFKTLLEIAFQPGHSYDQQQPQQVQYYADKLNINPNHFNAIVKRITDKSASEHIYQHILSLAKSKLHNSSDSVKEVAFSLYYSYPNHFANFFKSQTGKTPSQFRKLAQ